MNAEAQADTLAQLKRSLLALKDLRGRFDAVERARSEPIAIIGMACRVPGATSPHGFWQLLANGADVVSETPGERWDAASLYHADADAAGKVATRWGGFLEGIDSFDAAFFGISPREATAMDPQQRLLLEVAYEALEDAGQPTETLAGSKTGVFVGVHSHSSDYYLMQAVDGAALDTYSGTGTSHSVLAGRISYVFDLQGPSVALDTACSSSLVAVHQAVASLRSQETTMALAGGVNVMLEPTFTIAASRMRMLAADGRCKTFDAAADGFVRAEGCGVVVLKRLSDALASSDRVLAVIYGSAVNQDGHTNGLTAPNGLSQQGVVRAALANARVAPQAISYVEAHGTGTALGDPIEVEALAAVLGDRGPQHGPCLLGSAKTNIGHAEGAAGIVGLIKTVLSLRNQAIPPLAHFQKLNPHIALHGTPFVIPTTLLPWPAGSAPRYAGVSSFGWSGTNAHVVVGDAPRSEGEQWTVDVAAAQGEQPLLLPISARSPEALYALAERYERMLSGETVNLHDLCYSAAFRRSHHEHRLALVGSTAARLAEQLAAFTAGQPRPNLHAGRAGKTEAGAVLVFPGQGAQWFGMGRGLLAHEPAFRAAIEQCDQAIRAEGGWSVLEQLMAGEGEHRLDEIDVIQPVLFAIQVGLAALWRSRGVVPDAVVGHSMGEVAAAHVAGILNLEDAVRVICLRSRLMRQASGHGAMAVVELSAAAAQQAIGDYSDRLAVAVNNSPTSTVLSGDPAALAAVVAQLKQQDVFCRYVNVDVASHSPQMEPLCQPLREGLANIQPQEAAIPFYSTVTGAPHAGLACDGAYWARNVRQPVLFTAATRHLLNDGHGLFVELSPHPMLLSAIGATGEQANRSVAAIGSLQRNANEPEAMLGALGALYAAGYTPDWRQLYAGGGACVPLPGYPWQHERFWIRPTSPAPARAKRGTPEHPPRQPGAQTEATERWLYAPEWKTSPWPAAQPARAGEHWLVFADESGVATAFAEQLRANGAACTLVFQGDDVARIDAHQFVIRAGDKGDMQQLLDQAFASAACAGIVHLWSLNAPANNALDAAALEQTQDTVCGSVIHLIQSLTHRKRPAPRVWVGSRGAQPVRAGDEPALAQAPVWGLGLVAAEEQTDLWGGMIDLDPRATVSESAIALQQIVGLKDREFQQAVRAGERYLARLARLNVTKPTPLRWRADGAYVITGAFGAVGTAVARWAVEQGARRLILVGRTPLPPRREWAELSPETAHGQRVALVRELEARGASIHVAALDVGDETQLGAFLQTYRAEGWPPIRGVLHAAAVVEDRLLTELDLAAFHAVCKPKIRGGWLLSQMLNDLDFFVLFSSLGAVLGQVGQANYAAANAFLDALAHQRRACGRAGLSINWGAWQELGLAKTAGARQTIRLLEQGGIASFSASQGVEALGMLMQQTGTAQAAVAPIDWRALARNAAVSPFLSELAAREANNHAVAVHAMAQTSQRAMLAQAAPDQRAALLEPIVQRQVAHVLKLAPERIEFTRPLGALGLDSLTSVELRRRLETELELPLPATIAWNYPTVADMAGYLAGRIALADTTAAAPTTPASEPALGAADPDVGGAIGAVEELSDEEAMRLLLEDRK